MSRRLHTITTSVAVIGLCLGSTRAQWFGSQPEFTTTAASFYTFEDDVPVSFRPNPESHLRLNHRYYLEPGDTSLRWDWDRKGAWFDILLADDIPRDQTPFATGTGTPRLLTVSQPVLSVWLYSESPQDGMTSFAFMANDTIHHEVLIALHFHGWRRVRIAYPSSLPRDTDRLRISAPPQSRTGTIYFDNLSTWTLVFESREAPPRQTLWPTPSAPDIRPPVH